MFSWEKNLETSIYVVLSYCKSDRVKSFSVHVKTLYWFLSCTTSAGAKLSCVCGTVLRLMLKGAETEP